MASILASARAQVGAGDGALVTSFVISGGAKRVLVIATGPSLSVGAASVALTDPQLFVFSGNRLAGSNDNWGGDAAIADAIQQAGLPALSSSSKDAALLMTLSPGSYTAVVSAGGTAGLTVLQVIDLP